jgi:hypothetical protein
VIWFFQPFKTLVDTVIQKSSRCSSFRQGLPESSLQGSLSIPSLALDTRIPAGMTGFLALVALMDEIQVELKGLEGMI